MEHIQFFYCKNAQIYDRIKYNLNKVIKVFQIRTQILLKYVDDKNNGL